MNKIFTLLLLFCGSLWAQIDRVEPPFWYAGMKNPELQIMFHGKNISGYQVSVSNNIVIKEVTKTENPNYLFVTIDTQNQKAQDLTFSFKNGNKVVLTSKYSLKERRANSANRKSYDSSDVIYLLMPDRFANGNPKNDSHPQLAEKANRTLPGGRHGGDIEGMIQNLDYIKSVGATTIWPTPLCEDNDPTYSYHTYAQSDLYKIDPRYGTNEDYKRLSDEAHKRGLKLIKDYVTNHWGATHWMMNDLPTYNWLHQFPGYGQTNYRMTTQFDTNASKIDSKYCMDGWFTQTMPDINQSNPLALKYLIQNAIWWIEFADLDGLRVDTFSYNDKDGIAAWDKAILDEYPNLNIVGEVWMHDQAQMAYWQKDSKIGAIQNYNSYLPSVMDFTLMETMATALNENEHSWNKGLVNIYENFTNDFLYPNPNNLLIFAENHDTNRILDVLGNDFDKYKLAMTLLATTRGIPQIYYGTEIGMSGNKDKLGDADIRKDFPGGWKGDTNNAFTKAGRTELQNKFFDLTAKLFNWRKENPVIHTGKLTHFVPENNTYVYFRSNDQKTVMVVLNNSKTKQNIPVARFAEGIKNFKNGTDILSNQTIDLTKNFEVEPMSALVLELK